MILMVISQVPIHWQYGVPDLPNRTDVINDHQRSGDPWGVDPSQGTFGRLHGVDECVIAWLRGDVRY